MAKYGILKSLIKLPKSIVMTIIKIIKWWVFKIAKNWVILNHIDVSIRPALWKITGCNIGKNVAIGYDVYYDVSNAQLINLEDNVWIASRVLILCHKRDLSAYFKDEAYMTLPYLKSPVVVKKGACVSMGAIILPGITIGEGAIVGAGSLVIRDVPPWTVVSGNPAKVLRKIPPKN